MKQTAIKIAEAVLVPIYGSQDVAGERPFGGVATVKLQRSDGRIISVVHGK